MGFPHILDYKDALNIVKHHQRLGEKVVLTRGTFDIFHVGHLDFLTRAKNLGQVLIVNVNNDTWVTKRKGERPARDEKMRAMLVAGQEPVDYTFIHPSYDIHPAIALAILAKPDIVAREDKDPELQELEKKILFESLGYNLDYRVLQRSGYDESSSAIKQAIIDRAKEEYIRKRLEQIGIFYIDQTSNPKK